MRRENNERGSNFRSNRSEGGFRSNGGGDTGGRPRFAGPRDFSGPREMSKAICAECQTECEVPFKPTEGKPVYCRACYAKRRPQRF